MGSCVENIRTEEDWFNRISKHFFEKHKEVYDEQTLSIIADLEDNIMKESDTVVRENVGRLWNDELLKCIFAFKQEVREKILKNMKRQRAIILMERALSEYYKYISNRDVTKAVFCLAWEGLVPGMRSYKEDFGKRRRKGNYMGCEINEIKRYAINEMSEEKCGDKEKVLAVLSEMYRMKWNALREGYSWLENNEGKIFDGYDSRLKELANNGLKNVLYGAEPSMMEECMANDFWSMGFDGYDAMCAYMIIRGMAMIQEGDSPSEMERIFISLLPLELREEAKACFEQ